MSHYLLQNLVIDGITEAKPIRTQIVVDKLSHRKVYCPTISSSNVLIHHLFAIAYYGLHQHLFKLTYLLVGGVQTNDHWLAFFLALYRFLGLFATIFLLFLLAVMTYHAVHRVEQGFLFYAKSARQLGEVFIAQKLIVDYRYTLHDTTYSL